MYRDVEEAIAWLSNAFGFVEHYRYGDPISGAQMSAGNAWIMLKRGPARRCDSEAAWLWDAEPHRLHRRHRRRISSGRNLPGSLILEDLHETVYGELQYARRGPRWPPLAFSRHARNLSPDQWGATVSHAAVLTPQISPMLAVGDANSAIEFYKAAFDANVLWHLGGGEHVVAGSLGSRRPILSRTESPDYGTRGPAVAGFTTVRIELFVDDPEAVQRRALAAGAVSRSPITEHSIP